MLTTKQAAEYVGLKPQTMRLLKHSDEGPCLPFQLFPPLRRKDPPPPGPEATWGVARAISVRPAEWAESYPTHSLLSVDQKADSAHRCRIDSVNVVPERR